MSDYEIQHQDMFFNLPLCRILDRRTLRTVSRESLRSRHGSPRVHGYTAYFRQLLKSCDRGFAGPCELRALQIVSRKLNGRKSAQSDLSIITSLV